MRDGLASATSAVLSLRQTGLASPAAVTHSGFQASVTLGSRADGPGSSVESGAVCAAWLGGVRAVVSRRQEVDPGEVSARRAPETSVAVLGAGQSWDAPPLRGGPVEGGHQPALRRFRSVAAGQVVTDALCVVAALIIPRVSGVGAVPEGRFVPALVIAPILWVAVFHGFGLYRVLHLAAEDEFRRLIAATSVAVGLLMLVEAWWNPAFSRSRLAFIWGLALLLELVTRRIWRWSIRMGKRRGDLALRTLVIGTNEEARQIEEAINSPARGFIAVGHIRTAASGEPAPDVPILGSVDDLESVIRRGAVECLFVASSAVSPEEMLRLSRVCRQTNVEMKVSANLPGVLTSRLTIQSIHEVMAVSVRPARLTGAQAALKRSFDLVVGLSAFVVLLPLIAAIALAIRLTSRGPVVFRQLRVTRDDRTFTMLKFRTMVVDPERALEGKLIDLTKPFFKMRDDPRLTPIGRVLRALSLDELPQLWNVIKGDMAIVGPRPLPVEQVVANPDLLAPRHEVRSGVTGWWQINGRSEVDYERAVRMDLFYIENWSLSLDVYILLKTLGAIVAKRGAY